jgi:hypothetical protein
MKGEYKSMQKMLTQIQVLIKYVYEFMNMTLLKANAWLDRWTKAPKILSSIGLFSTFEKGTLSISECFSIF